MRFIALTKVVTLKQGNNYVLGALISIIQTIEEGIINQGAWFTQKLQNDIFFFQQKVNKLGNSLIALALTIIGKFYEGKWAQEEGQAYVLKRRTWIIIDVQVVLLVSYKKKREGTVVIMVGEHLELLLLQEGDNHNIAPQHVTSLLVPKTWEDIVASDGDKEQS